MTKNSIRAGRCWQTCALFVFSFFCIFFNFFVTNNSDLASKMYQLVLANLCTFLFYFYFVAVSPFFYLFFATNNSDLASKVYQLLVANLCTFLYFSLKLSRLQSTPCAEASFRQNLLRIRVLSPFRQDLLRIQPLASFRRSLSLSSC